MKKLMLTGLSFLFAMTMLFAQGVNPEDKAKTAVAELTDKLTLTEEKQAPIYQIVLDQMKGKMALKSDTTLDADMRKGEMKALMSTAHAKINELLTEEQKTLFVKYIEEKQANKKKM